VRRIQDKDGFASTSSIASSGLFLFFFFLEEERYRRCGSSQPG